MVRNQASQSKLPDGVQVAVADFDDAASLAAALDGAGQAYLVTPSSEQAEAQQNRFADLAAKAGVGHLVVLSQLAAAPDSPVRFLRYHAAVEQHIRDLGIGYTFLRPNLFFQGLLALAKPIAAEGRFFAPIGDAPVSAVDVRDIADVAAAVLTGAALTQAGHEGATYTLTGPAAVTGSWAWPIRQSRPAGTCGMVRVSLQNHPLTASAALVWSADLPRPLQQLLFETADSLTAPASPRPAELVSMTTG